MTTVATRSSFTSSCRAVYLSDTDHASVSENGWSASYMQPSMVRPSGLSLLVADVSPASGAGARPESRNP